MPWHSFKYDAFISHAVEDKIPFANELYDKLKSAGLNIWYSGKEFSIGGSIENNIKEGLRNSRYGIVVFSPNYVSKNWPMKEFHALWYRDGKGNGKEVILPVLLNIDLAELAKKDLDIVDKWAVKADLGVDYVADKLIEHIRKETLKVQSDRWTLLKWVLGIVMVCVLTLFFWKSYKVSTSPSKDDVVHLVRETMSSMPRKIASTVEEHGFDDHSTKDKKFIDSVYRSYLVAKSYYRNEYKFDDGISEISSRKKVGAVLGLDVQELSPTNTYSISAKQYYWHRVSNSEVAYAIANEDSVEINVVEIHPIKDNVYATTVEFKNNIRYVEVSLTFPKQVKDTKRKHISIIGLRPKLHYLITTDLKGEWQLREAKSSLSEIIE